MSPKPTHLYHGSLHKITGPLEPILLASSPNHIHTEAAVFATENIAIASLFLSPVETLVSVGFEEGIAYICIWGTPEEFREKDTGAYMYILPAKTFEKRGKAYEWQSREAVVPDEVRFLPSVLDGMKELGVQIYFITDDELFDRIQAQTDGRLEMLESVGRY